MLWLLWRARPVGCCVPSLLWRAWAEAGVVDI
jgi:hypothetical protein